MEIQTAARGYFSSKLLLLFAIAQRYYKGQTHKVRGQQFTLL